jgi:hypothetical protein
MKRTFALTAFMVLALAAALEAAPVNLVGAAATYARPTFDFPVTEAIDGNTAAGGWALNGDVETLDPQAAIFTTGAPLGLSDLNFAMNFTSCCDFHSINEFRISATSDAVPSLLGGNWTALDLSNLQASSAATTLASQPGSSVRALGAGGAFDIFAGSTVAPFAGITGFKLDVIPFDRNGNGSPTAGNAPNGNFVLSEFRVDNATPFLVKDLAIGGIATASGPLYTASPAALIDGDINTLAHGDGPGGPNGVPNAPGFHYDINLGQGVNFDHIEILPRNNCCNDRLTKYRVSVLDDNNGSPGAVRWTADMRLDGSLPAFSNPPPDVLTAGTGLGSFTGQWLRIESLQNPNPAYVLQINEVSVFGEYVKGPNVALGKPTSGDVAFGFPTSNANDGRIDTISHSLNNVPASWQVDLQQAYNLTEIELVNRSDGCCPERLDGAVLTVLDENFDTIYSSDVIAGLPGAATLSFTGGGLGFANARYIRVDQLSPDGDSYLSLAEVRAYGAAVPEPSTFVLAALGIAGMAWRRRGLQAAKRQA